LQKRRRNETVWDFPAPGDSLKIPVISIDKTEEFLIDIGRSRIVLAKVTYQTRWQSVVILVRLDLNGPAHRNPDGTDVPCPHLHIYRQGFGDKWARPLDVGEFPGIGDLLTACDDFMAFCSVVLPPNIQRTLFT
jgi:hypothetical protein